MKFLNRIDAFVGMLILPIMAVPTGMIFLIELIRKSHSYEADIMGFFSGIFLGTWIILLTIFFLTGVFKILTVNEKGISWKSIFGYRQFYWNDIIIMRVNSKYHFIKMLMIYWVFLCCLLIGKTGLIKII